MKELTIDILTHNMIVYSKKSSLSLKMAVFSALSAFLNSTVWVIPAKLVMMTF